MRRVLTQGVILVVMLIQPIASCGQETADSQEKLTDSKTNIRVAPAVELALVLTALSPLGQEDPNYDPIDRDGEYFELVQKRFGPFRTHPAVAKLGDDFNMPRLVGNAADFEFDGQGKLVELTTDGSLWGDREGDIFRDHLSDIQDFANKSGFQEFYGKNVSRYQELESLTSDLVDVDDMKQWLDVRFAARPAKPQILISPLIYSHHWTSGEHQKILRIWVRPPNEEWAAKAGPGQKMLFAGSIFTELDHPYVNPVSAQHRDAIGDALSRVKVWGTDQAWDSYNSPESVFNEYMTYSVFLLYARDRLDDDVFAKVRERIFRRMSHNRGFVRFPSFANQVLLRYRGGDLTPLFKPMIDWCAGFQDAITNLPPGSKTPTWTAEDAVALAERFNDPMMRCEGYFQQDIRFLPRPVERDDELPGPLPFSHTAFNAPYYEHPGMLVGPLGLAAPLVGAQAALAQPTTNAKGESVFEPVMFVVAKGSASLSHDDQAAISRSCPHFFFQGAMTSAAGRIGWVALRLADGKEIGIINGRVLDLSVGNLIAIRQQASGAIVIHQHMQRLEPGTMDELAAATGQALREGVNEFLNQP